MRRLTFWGAVAGVSVLANFAVEVIAHRYPQVGLSKFVAYTHRGLG